MPTSSPGQNLTLGMPDVPPLYMQQFRARPSASQGLSALLALQYTFKVADFHWQAPLIYCPSLGRFGDGCLADLQPGQSIDLSGFVFSLYLRVDLQVGWRIFPLSYPYFCLEAAAGAEIPGRPGTVEAVSYCSRLQSTAPTSGMTASIEIGGGGACIEVSDLPSTEPGIDRARVSRLGCCDDPVTISAAGTTFNGLSVGGTSIASSFNFVNALAAMPAAPPACEATPTFIGPAVLTLKEGATTQLTPRNANCKVIPGGFPSGTAFAIEGVSQGQMTGTIATISNEGLVAGGSTSGVAVASVTIPGSLTALTTCSGDIQPLVQVVPMTIYINFLQTTIDYMRGSFGPRGLALSAAEVIRVQNTAVARVQELFKDAGVHIVVVTESPPQRGNPGFNTDGVIEVIVALELRRVAPSDPNSALETVPTRKWTDSGTVTLGRADFNSLNWLQAFFGIDTAGFDTADLRQPPPSKKVSTGVFINRIPLINRMGLRVRPLDIGVALGNVIAHEVAHSVGAVPDKDSENLMNFAKDERFGGVKFNQSTSRHSPKNDANVMSPETHQSSLQGNPSILNPTSRFRNQVAAYLRAVLPVPLPKQQ